MPSANMPLRQYPSHQAIRHPDGLRQQGHAPREVTGTNGQNSKSSGAYQKIFPPVGVHDFQEFPSRRPNTANNASVSRPRYEAPSPMPSYHPPSVDTQELTKSASFDIDLEGRRLISSSTAARMEVSLAAGRGQRVIVLLVAYLQLQGGRRMQLTKHKQPPSIYLHYRLSQLWKNLILWNH